MINKHGFHPFSSDLKWNKSEMLESYIFIIDSIQKSLKQ